MRKRLTVLIVVDEEIDRDHDHEIGVEIDLGVERRVRELLEVPRRELPHGKAPHRRRWWNTSRGRFWGRNTSSGWIFLKLEGERRI
jgi:hypothetical protein